MSGRPLFSIIVPCCDVEPYVADCVASLKVQAESFEAIFVVETSRDKTAAEVQRCLGDDARFRLICEPRSGSPATPRNTGLDVATGEYVIFLDGDDTLASTALADLADWIRRFPTTDLFPCAVQEGEMRHDNYPVEVKERVLSGSEATCLVSACNVEPMAMAQMTVYRRAFLVEQNLRFADGLRHEDEEFTPRALYLATSVVPTHLPFYLYRRRADSITTGRTGGHLEDVAVVYRNLFKFHRTVAPSAAVSRAWARNWLNTFYAVFFYPGGGRPVDPVRRKKALKICFAEGMAGLACLARFASCPKRVAAACLRFGWRVGWLGPVSLFFRWFYYPLAMRKS